MTTLYNHISIGTKPLIPNLEFKEVHESLLRGEKEMYEEAVEKYSLESFQKMVLESEYKKIKSERQFA